MLKPGDIAIVSGSRTPMGRYGGKLRDFTAQELGAIAAKCAIDRAGVDPKEFDHAVFGNAQQTSGDALYGGPDLPGLSRHFLHASRLAFGHPDGSRVRYESELPPDLVSPLRDLER